MSNDDLQPLQPLTAFERTVVQDYAASYRDLRDLEYSDRQARRITATYQPSVLAAAASLQVPPPALGAPDLVALVPGAELSRQLLGMRAYVRDASLQGQVRLAASYIGTNSGGRIKELYPITARHRIGSAQALGQMNDARAQAVASLPGTAANWPAAAWFYALDDPMSLGLDLGYRRNGAGAVSGIPGVRHYHLNTLQALATSRGVLRGAPTA